MFKIAVDVMGFENDVSAAVLACREFLLKFKNLKIVLVGDQNEILKTAANDEFEIVHTEEFVNQNDTILNSRRKPNSSLQLIANLLKDGVVDGVLSAGSTPIFVYTMYSTIGLMEGIKKPGFMPTFPTIDGITFNMIDVGASVHTDGLDLTLFAIMANEFAKQRVSLPKIGILNIGTEEHKGFNYHHEANVYLKQLEKLNYAGFVEPGKLLEREVDIAVTDGFTGNIALKAMEGASRVLSKAIKEEFKKPKNIFGALLSLGVFKKVKAKFDYKNYAGAFVLGLNKVVVKTHGSADKQQFFSALRMLYECLENNILEKIKNAVKEFYDNDFKRLGIELK